MRRIAPQLAACALLLAASCGHRGAATWNPLKARLDRARPGDRIELGPGRFRADLFVDKPVVLVGAGRDRTVLEGTVTVLAAGSGLEDLSVRGAGQGTALLLRGSAHLRRVRISNERGEVVKVLAGRTLDAEELAVECVGRSKLAAVVVLGEARLAGLEVKGDCRRGLDVQHGRATVDGGLFAGARDTGVRAIDSVLTMRDVRIELREEPEAVGLFAARSELEVTRATVLGGEQGILVRGGRARLDQVTVRGQQMAALGLVGADALISRATLAGPFAHAAVVATDSPRVELEHVVIDPAGRAGVLGVRSTIHAEDVSVAGATVDGQGDFGHGFSLDDSTADLAGLSVNGAEGGLVWASGSTVRVSGATGAKVAFGFVATLGGDVRVSDATVNGGEVGAAVLQRGSISVERSRLTARVPTAGCGAARVEVDGRAMPVLKSCSDPGMPKGFR